MRLAPQLCIFQVLQMVVEGFVVFIPADAQTFTSGELHIITAVAGDAAGIDQIGFMDAHKLAVFLTEACFNCVELLVKGVAPVCGDDVGAPSLGGKIPYLADGDMEVLRSDIIGEGIGVVQNCLIGEGSVCAQVFPALVGHDVDWFEQCVLGGRRVAAPLRDNGDQPFICALGLHHNAAHHAVFLFHVIEEDVGTVAFDTSLELIGIVVAHHGDWRFTPLEKVEYLAFHEVQYLVAFITKSKINHVSNLLNFSRVISSPVQSARLSFFV